jgi:hypothetical protein
LELLGKRKMTATAKPRHLLGRPVENPLPEPIDDSPENVMRAILATQPRKDEDWKYLKEAEN